MSQDYPGDGLSFFKKVKNFIFGSPKNINDPGILHKIALIPFFAWIGLGADGLSSSAYGPEEAFKAIGSHSYMLFFLGITTAITVLIISFAYTKIIEHFPNGGGGYIVASQMIGKQAGVVSGSALIVDYILTVTVSIVSCVDALFSYLPIDYGKYKMITAAILILFLIILNIRGLKESIKVLAPIFMIFIITHIILLSYGIFSNLYELPAITSKATTNLSNDVSQIGYFAILMIFLRAFSLGGGTYTGIEAVSNGLQVMREPRVQTGKKTMLYLALSLAIAASGLYLCYLLIDIKPISGKTLNSVLADTLYGDWKFGSGLAFITIFSEGAILLVAAQAGFIDAPRVMANMAVDSWLPRRFASLSERLTMRNGIIIIGISSLIILFISNGSISALIVMYSINVFLTFSLSFYGMTKFIWQRRKEDKEWIKHISIFSLGLLICLTILGVTVFEKFHEGGWITLIITSSLIIMSFLIKRHYTSINNDLMILEENAPDIFPNSHTNNTTIPNPKETTAIQLVGSFNGFGIHTFLSIIKSFPDHYKNYIFVSVAIVDQGLFKGNESIDALKENVQNNLDKYVQMARSLGLNADSRMTIGTDLVESASDLCIKITEEFRKSTVFTGKLAFREETFFHRLLHNESSYSIQRRLQWKGITNVILPIRINA